MSVVSEPSLFSHTKFISTYFDFPMLLLSVIDSPMILLSRLKIFYCNKKPTHITQVKETC